MSSDRFAASALALSAVLAVAAGRDAFGQPTDARSSRNVTVTLVPEKDGLEAGQPLWIGLHFKIADDWHTYWKNPGDAGIPIRVKWRLPEGYSAAGLEWPSPERFASGPLMSYGYAGEALLLTELRAPKTPSGGATRIGAHVEWLECKEACLPGKADLEIALDGARGSRPLADWAPTFRRFRGRLPRVEPRLEATAAAAGQDVTLTLRGIPTPARAYFFAAQAEVVEHAAPQPLTRDGSGFSLRLKRAANATLPTRIEGVLEADGVAYEIQAPLR